MYILALTFVLLPGMFKTAPYYRKIIIAQHFYAVAHETPRTFAVFHEIKLKLGVTVQRVIKTLLVPVDKIEAVF